MSVIEPKYIMERDHISVAIVSRHCDQFFFRAVFLNITQGNIQEKGHKMHTGEKPIQQLSSEFLVEQLF